MVLKKKDKIDGVLIFKARNATLGFMIVPEAGLTERFSPVDIDSSLKIQVAIRTTKTYKGSWRTQSYDIEAAFLDSTRDNIVFIEPHPEIVEYIIMTEKQRHALAMLLKK